MAQGIVDSHKKLDSFAKKGHIELKSTFHKKFENIDSIEVASSQYSDKKIDIKS